MENRWELCIISGDRITFYTPQGYKDYKNTEYRKEYSLASFGRGYNDPIIVDLLRNGWQPFDTATMGAHRDYHFRRIHIPS